MEKHCEEGENDPFFRFWRQYQHHAAVIPFPHSPPPLLSQGIWAWPKRRRYRLTTTHFLLSHPPQTFSSILVKRHSPFHFADFILRKKTSLF